MSFWCCCQGCPSTTITFTVNGCGGTALAGASVHLTGPGGFDQTNITDALGHAAFTVTSDGVYSYSISKSLYVTATGSITITTCTSATRTVLLTPQAGYSCLPDSCCPQGGSAPYPVLTWPDTLSLDDGISTITLTKTGTPTAPFPYRGSAIRTAAEAYQCSTDPTGSPWPLGTDVDVPVYFELGCTYLLVTCNDCGPISGSGACYQNRTTIQGALTVTYPSDNTDSGTSCYHGYGDNSIYSKSSPINAGVGFGAEGTASNSACPSSFAGSAYVLFLAGGKKSAPWQIYGDDETFTWVQ